MCCANASGTHKLKLAVVGKSKNPRAFKHLNPRSFPVDYYSQKAAWMDRQIFKMWFFEKFVPQVKTFLSEHNLPPKAVLLLDNAPAHPDELKSEDGNIFVKYFPPNVTSIAQPMDQGVIETMKRLYRKNLMMQMLGEEDYMKFWKSLNLRDAIYAVARAWEKVKESNIKHAFYKIMTLEETDIEDDQLNDEELSNENIASLASSIGVLGEISTEEVQEWVECDQHCAIFNDDDNSNHTTVKDIESDQNDDSDESECVLIKRSHQEANDAVNILIEYFDEKPEANGMEGFHLRKIKEVIKNRIYSSKKQQKITDFFK